MELEHSARVLIVEDHAVLRDGLVRAVDLTQGLEVVGAVGNARAALNAMNDVRPDILLSDIVMPGLSVFDAGRQIRGSFPEVRLVVMTGFASDLHIDQAMRIPVDGFLIKDEPMEFILEALLDVAHGKRCFSRGILERLGQNEVAAKCGTIAKAHKLSNRELEVLSYLANGLTRRKISETMCISPRTVDRHVENLMAKTGIHDRVGLTRFALREGLVDTQGTLALEMESQHGVGASVS